MGALTQSFSPKYPMRRCILSPPQHTPNDRAWPRGRMTAPRP